MLLRRLSGWRHDVRARYAPITVRHHAAMQILDRFAARALKEGGKHPVQNARKARKHHGGPKAPGLTEVYSIGLADRGGVFCEGLMQHTRSPIPHLIRVYQSICIPLPISAPNAG